MSRYQNQGRKLTQEEIDRCENLANRIMSESEHWREFYLKKKDIQNKRERGVLSSNDLLHFEFELMEFCN